MTAAEVEERVVELGQLAEHADDALRPAVPVEGDVDQNVGRVARRVEQHAVVIGACVKIIVSKLTDF